MDTASTGYSVDHLLPASAVEVLPDFEDQSEVASQEEIPAAADVRPLLLTRNPRMTAILQSAGRAALVPATILLIGESGAGKRLLARQIHDWSPCHRRRFVPVDCARISQALVEAETLEVVTELLTGTGADTTNGHECAPGTIFLENIADLEFEAQAKLLDFAGAQRLNRLSRKSDKSWTRIIAASNRDLASEVAATKFRADLFYRINVVSLRIPPLRERPEDVLRLAESVLREEAIRYGRPNLQFSPGAEFAIQHRPWLGNVPELASVIESAVILSEEDLIGADDIPELSAWYAPAAPAPVGAPVRKLCEVERDYIAQILASGVSAQEAAEMLGISSSTLCRKRKRHKLC
jgi:two-component system, NtrC family, response regulator AlgB